MEEKEVKKHRNMKGTNQRKDRKKKRGNMGRNK